MEHGDRFWEWRDELLKHPSGRALGGEPCVQCGNGVPPNTDWRHRDRHVCGTRCNTNLSRKFRRKLNKLGDRGFSLPMPVATPDPRDQIPEPMLFTTVEDQANSIEFGHLGFAPRPGDQVIRFGETTHFAAAEPDVALRLTFGNESCVILLIHESGWIAVVGADEIGRTNRTMWGIYSPDGERFEHNHQLEHGGRRIRLVSETIRDIDEQDRDVEWSTFVWAPADSAHPGTVWTDAYHDRSARRRRTTRSQSAHARRVRVANATIERFDPHEIYERDQWICQLCAQPVESDLEYPDPLYPSLDHIVPLAANGEHSRINTQLAHWICNVRKGATHSESTSNLKL